MTIPRKPRTQQPLFPLAPDGTTLTPPGLVPTVCALPDNDAEPGPAPAICPTCGKRLVPRFDARASGLLDMVLLAKDVLSDLQAALEEEGQP
jgi:hypothetical protein